MNFKLRFVAKLESLVNSDINLSDSLLILSKIFKGNESKKILEVRHRLEQGNSLSNSFSIISSDAEFRTFFLIVEKTGKIKEVLNILKEKYEFEDNIKKETINILIYPIIIFVLSILIFVVMLVFVVPQFVGIYDDMNVEIPIITKIIINVSNYILNKYFIIIIFLVFLIFFILFLNRVFREYVDEYILYIGYFRNRYLLEFTQNMYILLFSGFDLIESIRLTRGIQNIYLSKEFNNIAIKLNKGFSVYKAFRNCKIFDEEYISYIEIGEKIGKLKENFKILRNLLMKNIILNSKRYVKILEPLSIIIVALFISIIIFSIMLPIFNIGDVIV